MQQRGGGEWERSLVVRGEDICAFDKEAISMVLSRKKCTKDVI